MVCTREWDCDYRIAQNFDGYWLFKYLTENILTDGDCLSPYTCKRPIVFKQFDGLNFDGLAGKHQKCQNFPPSKVCVILYIIRTTVTKICHEYAQSETSSAARQRRWNTTMPFNNLSFPNKLLASCLNFSDKGYLHFKFVSYT